MITLQFEVTSQSITRIDAWPLVSGSVSVYKADFAFDASWDGLARIAVFTGSGLCVHVALTNDSCVVPWEPLRKAGKLYIGVYGVSGTTIFPTLWVRSIPVSDGACVNGEPASEPTPGMVEQLVSKVNMIDQRTSTYVHAQSTPSSHAIISHYLNKYPSCTVVDSAGTEIVCGVDYIDRNVVRVTLSAECSWKAYLN